jgi:hypothetical protein
MEIRATYKSCAQRGMAWLARRSQVIHPVMGMG